MKKTAVLVLSIVLSLWLINAAPAERAANAQVGEPAPDFTLVDSHGQEHSLSDFRGQVVVLEWLNHECPFVRKFYNAGKMQELQQRYTEKDVVWLSIISSREGEQGWMTPEQINSANESKNVHATAVLIDEPGDVGRLYDARTTPQMYVINEEGVLVYNGAIDDKPTANPDDLRGAKNYVQLALDSVLSGEAVEISTTRPYGCSVKY